MYIKKWSSYLQNLDLLVHSEHKELLKILTGYTDNENVIHGASKLQLTPDVSKYKF